MTGHDWPCSDRNVAFLKMPQARVNVREQRLHAGHDACPDSGAARFIGEIIT